MKCYQTWPLKRQAISPTPHIDNCVAFTPLKKMSICVKLAYCTCFVVKMPAKVKKRVLMK